MKNQTKIHMQVTITDLHKISENDLKKIISRKQKEFDRKVWQSYLISKKFGS
jgi:hypothetical protein